MAYFETDDRLKIFYEVHGSGPPIVFVHGLTANHRHFKYQTAAFQAKYQVIIYDLRGHGDSPVADHALNMHRQALDLAQLMEHLDLTGVCLVGWSLGAHIIFEYIRKFGCHRLDRLAIIDMTPKLLKSDNWQLGLRGLNGKDGDFGLSDNTQTLAALLHMDWAVFSRLLAERLYDKALTVEGRFDDQADFKGKADMEWIYEQALRNRAYVIAAMWISMSVQDYRSLLSTIDVSALITYGEGSNYYSPANSQYMCEQIPEASLVAFPGCGHALHIQDPDRFNAALESFLSA